MIILISGATHTGKTALSQRLLERLKYPYLSIDHLKMGLIRSGNTNLTPLSSDGELTEYLWPVVREIIKTAIENGQNLIVEGCYIPFDYKNDFTEEYLKEIKYTCLIMSENYIRSSFDDIISFESVIEKRLERGAVTADELIEENLRMLKLAQKQGVNYILIDGEYNIDKAFLLC